MNATALAPHEHYLAEFARIDAGGAGPAPLPGRHLPWLQRVRQEALAQFAETGFPTLRQEDWKYTSVAAIEKSRFAVATQRLDGLDSLGSPSATHVEALALPGMPLLVFVNGCHQPGLSRLDALPGGVTLCNLAAALERDAERLQAVLAHQSNPFPCGFAALNAAFMVDGAYLHLAAGAAIETPIHLLFLTTEPNLAIHSRNIIVADENSCACIIEHHAALDGLTYFTNTVTDIVTARGAQLEHHKLQQESLTAFHVAAINVNQQHASRFTSSSFALGGGLARVDINVALNAEKANCALDGLYMTDGHQHVDHHTRIDHARPHGTSREFYKGVLAGASRAVFNGKVIVHPDAQQSDAYQSNRNLLLSEHAEIDTKPQLEIYADDVKCSHGATVGQLDADQIYYLRSRGVDEASARALLTFAFADEVVTRLNVAPLRARLGNLLRGRLPEQVKGLP